MDRLTFILSKENGFIWDDIYASTQIDNFAKSSSSLLALSKLYGLLKIRGPQVELTSLEAKRRITFFVNSLFMDMPSAPALRHSKEYTVITPFYSEDVLLSRDDLEQKNEDGVTTLLYLQTLYKRDWSNFIERQKILDEGLIWSPSNLLATRMWAR